jgi:hypothetical protein
VVGSEDGAGALQLFRRQDWLFAPLMSEAAPAPQSGSGQEKMSALTLFDAP